MLRRFIGWSISIIWFFQPSAVYATQTHGEPEGLFVHQSAHMFFTFTMGLLIYWLRKRGLVSRQGWRHIQYAAIFFIAWNLDAFVSHWLLKRRDPQNIVWTYLMWVSLWRIVFRHCP